MTVTDSLPVIDAVRRELEIDEQLRDGRRTVRAVLTLVTGIARSPAQLWPLLTRPEELTAWFGPITGTLVEGGTFTGDRGSGRILQVQSPHRIELAWERDGAEDGVLIRLDPEDDGTTRLHLRHTAVVDAAEFERTGPGGLALGWELLLLALAARTDGWRDSCLMTPPEPTGSWLRSEQGLACLRAWAVRWAAEAMAAGIAEPEARRGEAEALRRQLEA